MIIKIERELSVRETWINTDKIESILWTERGGKSFWTIITDRGTEFDINEKTKKYITSL